MNEPLESFVNIMAKIQGLGYPLSSFENVTEIISQFVEVMLQADHIFILLLLLHFCQAMRLPLAFWFFDLLQLFSDESLHLCS